LLSLLSYSDQWLADGDQLSAEGYCHWDIFLICVINGYGERRLPINEQHIKKQKVMDPRIWLLVIIDQRLAGNRRHRCGQSCLRGGMRVSGRYIIPLILL
jgi:hypothetical protein